VLDLRCQIHSIAHPSQAIAYFSNLDGSSISSHRASHVSCVCTFCKRTFHTLRYRLPYHLAGIRDMALGKVESFDEVSIAGYPENQMRNEEVAIGFMKLVHKIIKDETRETALMGELVLYQNRQCPIFGNEMCWSSMTPHECSAPPQKLYKNLRSSYCPRLVLLVPQNGAGLACVSQSSPAAW